MGAWGALIMSFFGAVFASLTLYWERQVAGGALALPFLAFALIAFCACLVICRPGEGLKPTPGEERAIMWSSIGEGIGLFLASSIVINLHRPDLLLPSMALVVGLHFLPIAYAARFPAVLCSWIGADRCGACGLRRRSADRRRVGWVHGCWRALAGIDHGDPARPSGEGGKALAA